MQNSGVLGAICRSKRCVTERSVSRSTPDFSSHAPYGTHPCLWAVYMGGA
ncbi:hypothetical protein CKA32_002764 [Geitlerinema sp. FC II]|nr:hypothetical protein CKA32_002764 [Geitlerinema sp. FC II]